MSESKTGISHTEGGAREGEGGTKRKDSTKKAITLNKAELALLRKGGTYEVPGRFDGLKEKLGETDPDEELLAKAEEKPDELTDEEKELIQNALTRRTLAMMEEQFRDLWSDSYFSSHKRRVVDMLQRGEVKVIGVLLLHLATIKVMQKDRVDRVSAEKMGTLPWISGRDYERLRKEVSQKTDVEYSDPPSAEMMYILAERLYPGFGGVTLKDTNLGQLLDKVEEGGSATSQG